ncbi:hypothetical protein STANM309S_04446 [Streptomyces tanashiensis]
MLLQLQGAFYFDLEGRITLDSPEAVRAMTLIKTMNDAASSAISPAGGTP